MGHKRQRKPNISPLKRAQDTDWLFLLPSIIFSSFVIMFVRLHLFSMPFSQFYWSPYTDDTQLADLFCYGKMVLIIILATIAFFCMCVLALRKEVQFRWLVYYVPLAVYLFFVILSYALSNYREFSLFGVDERFEGTIVIICYIFMAFYAMNLVKTEKNVKQLLWPIGVSSFVLGILGILQSIGHDFFQTEIGQKMISGNTELASGKTMWESVSEAFDKGEVFFTLKFTNNQIYQTVYNPNYVAFYLTLLIPIWGILFIKAILAGKEEKLWKKIAFGVLFSINLYNLLGSQASGGFIGIAVIGILGIVVLNKKLLKMWKPICLLLAMTIVTLLLASSSWLPEVKNTILNLVKSDNATGEISESTETNRPWLDYMLANDRGVSLSLNGNEINFIFAKDDVSITDGNGETLEAVFINEEKMKICDERFEKCFTFSLGQDENEMLYLFVYIDKTKLTFKYDGNTYCYVNEFGNDVVIDDAVETDLIFSNRIKFGSYRGYIWSRSIPLIKDYLLVGSGADTFAMAFPQDDYAGRFNLDDSEWMYIVIDKPHNMYLQTAICTGGISLLALIALYGIYVVQSIIIYRKKTFTGDFLEYAGLGIFLGITGFLFVGLVNDSSVSVMPLFYTLFGIGIAINRMNLAKNSALSTCSSKIG